MTPHKPLLRALLSGGPKLSHRHPRTQAKHAQLLDQSHQLPASQEFTEIDWEAYPILRKGAKSSSLPLPGAYTGMRRDFQLLS